MRCDFVIWMVAAARLRRSSSARRVRHRQHRHRSHPLVRRKCRHRRCHHCHCHLHLCQRRRHRPCNRHHCHRSLRLSLRLTPRHDLLQLRRSRRPRHIHHPAHRRRHHPQLPRCRHDYLHCHHRHRPDHPPHSIHHFPPHCPTTRLATHQRCRSHCCLRRPLRRTLQCRPRRHRYHRVRHCRRRLVHSIHLLARLPRRHCPPARSQAHRQARCCLSRTHLHRPHPLPAHHLAIHCPRRRPVHRLGRLPPPTFAKPTRDAAKLATATFTPAASVTATSSTVAE